MEVASFKLSPMPAVNRDVVMCRMMSSWRKVLLDGKERWRGEKINRSKKQRLNEIHIQVEVLA